MNFQKFTLISKIDEDDCIVIDVDLDTIDDDEPYLIQNQDSLDIIIDENNNARLSDNASKFTEAYEQDELFWQILWDIHDKGEGYTHERELYKIVVGDIFSQ